MTKQKRDDKMRAQYLVAMDIPFELLREAFDNLAMLSRQKDVSIQALENADQSILLLLCMIEQQAKSGLVRDINTLPDNPPPTKARRRSYFKEEI